MEIPCYRDIRTTKDKFKKRKKQVKIKLTRIDSEDSDTDINVLGCVNPGLYINILEEEVPIIEKEEAKKVKNNPGFADRSTKVRRRVETDHKSILNNDDFEEFNIYAENLFNSKKRIESKRNHKRKKRMRPSKSQHDLVEKKVPIEVLIEEENRKKNVGLSIGYEDEEIDPFDNNDFTIVDDYNTVRKNKDIEYNDQLESKILINKRTQEKSQNNEVLKRQNPKKEI